MCTKNMDLGKSDFIPDFKQHLVLLQKQDFSVGRNWNVGNDVGKPRKSRVASQCLTAVRLLSVQVEFQSLTRSLL